MVDREVRLGQIQFEQIGGPGQVQGARFGQWAGALFQDVGDVFATVSLVVVRVLEGARDLVGAVDFQQREDFLDMMPGVEPALPQLLFRAIRCHAPTLKL